MEIERGRIMSTYADAQFEEDLPKEEDPYEQIAYFAIELRNARMRHHEAIQAVAIAEQHLQEVTNAYCKANDRIQSMG